MFDPWMVLEGLAGWTLRHAPTPRRGLCDWSTKTISIDPSLTAAEQRAVLTHELVHAERGPVPAWMRAREEQTVRAISARRLIELPPLIEAVSWSRIPVIIAQDLDVDADTVRARAEALDDEEAAAIAARLENIHLP